MSTAAAGALDFVYMPSHDAFYHLGVVAGRLNRTYRDGTTIDIGEVVGFGQTAIIAHTRYGATWTVSGLSSAFELDQITWQPDLTKPIGPGLSTTLLDEGLFLPNQAGTEKYYHPTGANLEVYNPTSGALEETINTGFPGSIDSAQFKQDQVVVLFDYSTGDVMFYDLIERSALLTTSIEPCIVAAFDTTYQTVCSVRTDFKLQTYSDKAAPFEFTALAFTPGNFDRWSTEVVRTQLRGSDGEPVVDMDVQWCLETIINANVPINTNPVNTLHVNAGGSSAPAQGVLIPEFTKTDSQGFTETTYCLPGPAFTPGLVEVISPKVRR